jgi:hypothetical protein
MGLLADFKAAAVARTRFPDDERLTPAALFALVRDMPYESPSDIRPETVVAEWRATAPGKHLLLQALYEEFGYGAMLIAALHEFSVDAMPWLPEPLRHDLGAGPIPDLHMFLRLHIGADWMTVDATWPLAATRLGVPVNERFEPGREMQVPYLPDEILHVPPDADPLEFEQHLLERHVGAQRERRDRFIADLSAWLAHELAATEQPAR